MPETDPFENSPDPFQGSPAGHRFRNRTGDRFIVLDQEGVSHFPDGLNWARYDGTLRYSLEQFLGFGWVLVGHKADGPVDRGDWDQLAEDVARRRHWFSFCDDNLQPLADEDPPRVNDFSAALGSSLPLDELNDVDFDLDDEEDEYKPSLALQEAFGRLRLLQENARLRTKVRELETLISDAVGFLDAA